jgi:hypothetical protein
MAINSRHLDGLTAADVFRVLSDGKSYGYWVVGTRMVREVTGPWPQPGGQIHYTAGHVPLRKDDVTTSVACEPGQRLQLEARAWPMGSLHIEIQVLTSPTGCTVVIEEHPKEGLLKTLHNPLVDLTIKLRNVETLRRLERRVREQAGQPASA